MYKLDDLIAQRTSARRWPYYIEGFLRGTGEIVLFIMPIEIRTGTAYPLGIHESFVKFIHENCTCYSCGASFDDNFTQCACLNDPKTERTSSFYYMEARLSQELHGEAFEKLWERERRRQNKEIRLYRLSKNGGKHTKKDVSELYDLQEGMCFYCGASLSPDGKKTFEVDHFIPIIEGGGDGVNNIVLSCPACNSMKGGHFLGDSVTHIKDKELRKQLRAMRKRIQKYLESRGLYQSEQG